MSKAVSTSAAEGDSKSAASAFLPPARSAVSAMDAASIADITSLPVDKVKTVLRQHNMEKDQSGIERAINQFLEGTGPFKEAVQGSDWAESGKPRRGKKVRHARFFSLRAAVRAPRLWPACWPRCSARKCLTDRLCDASRLAGRGGDAGQQGRRVEQPGASAGLIARRQGRCVHALAIGRPRAKMLAPEPRNQRPCRRAQRTQPRAPGGAATPHPP